MSAVFTMARYFLWHVSLPEALPQQRKWLSSGSHIFSFHTPKNGKAVELSLKISVLSKNEFCQPCLLLQEILTGIPLYHQWSLSKKPLGVAPHPIILITLKWTPPSFHTNEIQDNCWPWLNQINPFSGDRWFPKLFRKHPHPRACFFPVCLASSRLITASLSFSRTGKRVQEVAFSNLLWTHSSWPVGRRV